MQNPASTSPVLTHNFRALFMTFHADPSLTAAILPPRPDIPCPASKFLLCASRVLLTTVLVSTWSTSGNDAIPSLPSLHNHAVPRVKNVCQYLASELTQRKCWGEGEAVETEYRKPAAMKEPVGKEGLKASGRGGEPEGCENLVFHRWGRPRFVPCISRKVADDLLVQAQP